MWQIVVSENIEAPSYQINVYSRLREQISTHPHARLSEINGLTMGRETHPEIPPRGNYDCTVISHCCRIETSPGRLTLVEDIARVTLPLGSSPCRPAFTVTQSRSRLTTTCRAQRGIRLCDVGDTLC